jgi:glycosyltransferase involved in cell wall biosynthesis
MTRHQYHDANLEIVLLTNIPAPYRIAVWNCLSQLAQGRLRVWFITASEDRRNWVVPTGEMYFPWQYLARGSNRLPAEAKAAASTLVQLARTRPQVIICGGYNSLAAWVCFLWSKLFRRRFVLWLESTARDARHPGKIKIWLKKIMVRRADGIAAAGKATVAYVRGLGASSSRIFLAPMSTDNRFFARQAAQVDPEEERQNLGYPRRLVLYSGRLDQKKGVYTLLHAFAGISAEMPDVGLLIAGHGPEQENMEDFCRRADLRQVYFLGPRQYGEMPQVYALADVLVLPTFSDTWGMVVNEAFACGVPAVVSSVAGACDDLIIDGQTGFKVRAGDPVELADRILQILRDPALRARMSANCRSLIQKYSPEACAQGLLDAARGTPCTSGGLAPPAGYGDSPAAGSILTVGYEDRKAVAAATALQGASRKY